MFLDLRIDQEIRENLRLFLADGQKQHQKQRQVVLILASVSMIPLHPSGQTMKFSYLTNGLTSEQFWSDIVSTCVEAMLSRMRTDLVKLATN